MTKQLLACAPQVLQQLQADDRRKEEAISLLEKTKRIKDKHLKQERARADQATKTLETALQRSTLLAKLVDPVACMHELRTVLKALLHCASGSRCSIICL